MPRHVRHPEARLAAHVVKPVRPLKTCYKILLRKSDGSGWDVRRSKPSEDTKEALEEAKRDRDAYFEFGTYDSAWIFQEWR